MGWGDVFDGVDEIGILMESVQKKHGRTIVDIDYFMINQPMIQILVGVNMYIIDKKYLTFILCASSSLYFPSQDHSQLSKDKAMACLRSSSSSSSFSSSFPPTERTIHFFNRSIFLFPPSVPKWQCVVSGKLLSVSSSKVNLFVFLNILYIIYYILLEVYGPYGPDF